MSQFDVYENPSKLLRNPVGSVETMRDEIIAAIDFAITGI